MCQYSSFSIELRGRWQSVTNEKTEVEMKAKELAATLHEQKVHIYFSEWRSRGFRKSRFSYVELYYDTHQISKMTFCLFQFESRHMYLSELRSIMHGRVRVT